MDIRTFNDFVNTRLNAAQALLGTKSADYSSGDDKLYNFKCAARIDGISPIEALRGMWLKHRASITQGLDDLQGGKLRPQAWWDEKLTDDLNYNLLLQALLVEKWKEISTKDGAPLGEMFTDSQTIDIFNLGKLKKGE